MTQNVDTNFRPPTDEVIAKIADYAAQPPDFSDEARETARNCLWDTIGCALMALNFPECTKHIGPVVEGAELIDGARVFGTDYLLDPVTAAFNIGCLVRWLDFNDTWLAAEWGHPSDNLGAILAVADFMERRGSGEYDIADVVDAMIQAHEIQGVLALSNSFNSVGLDHVLLVRVASTAVAARMLGANREQIATAVGHAFADGGALRTYRHAPNAGSRKSWAAGDATSRAVRLALIALRGEMDIPSVLTAPRWGFHDVLFGGNSIRLSQPFGSYVMENVLFKLSYPAEFHSQTAVEAAVQLHDQVKNRIEEIEKIEIRTHESAIRIISKQGPLANPADRDHCLQYMVAVPLLLGDLRAEHYEDSFHAAHPQIDQLREKMHILEDERFTREYLEADKRSIANAVRITFKDDSVTDEVVVEYPIGHRRRRSEGYPVLRSKFERSLRGRFPSTRAAQIMEVFDDAEETLSMSVAEFNDMLAATPLGGL